VNKEFENKFNELKLEYQKLVEEFEWNEIIYNSKFSFEPVIGEIYHLYVGNEGSHFLSLIPPNEWNKEHIGTFKLNSDKKWVKQL
jgi:predicted nucleotide-binding protein (sugar kinase/HSP70/actin superfamily)